MQQTELENKIVSLIENVKESIELDYQSLKLKLDRIILELVIILFSITSIGISITSSIELKFFSFAIAVLTFYIIIFFIAKKDWNRIDKLCSFMNTLGMFNYMIKNQQLDDGMKRKIFDFIKQYYEYSQKPIEVRVDNLIRMNNFFQREIIKEGMK